MRRTLLFAAALLVAPMLGNTAAAQTAPVVAELMKDIDGVEKKFVALAKATPPEKLAWRPGTGVRSFGEVFLHVASDNYFIPASFGTAIPASTGIKSDDFKTLTAYETRKVTREQIVSDLEKSFAHLKASMAKTTAAQLDAPISMFGMKSNAQGMWILATTHLHEHLGQAIAYARMNGIVPPWSK
ncbi:MAG TPA: DinB family protein [Gemmatimonas sp.]|uniref:DinB family protein n=1 Tax=Gemmatimonas sp. TaxID=1962908 RepID=UPI002EDB61E3